MKLREIIKDLLFNEDETEQKLYKGLISSYSPKTLTNAIKAIDPVCDVDYKLSSPDTMLIIFKDQDNLKIDKILHKIKACGWFPVGVDIINKKTKRSLLPSATEMKNIDKNLLKSSSLTNIDLRLYIEAKFSLEVTEYVLKNHNQLYHVTQTNYVEKIMKIGLLPKTKTKLGNHPDRIYLALDIKSADDFKSNIENLEDFKDKDFTLLKIDISFFKGSTSKKLYLDPQFLRGGVFTLSNIKPEFISIEKKYD